jgi:hypothetical protein
MYAFHMNWTDDITLEGANKRRALLQLGMYAQYLGTGSTLYCRQIKVDTIKKYIRDVARFLALFGTHERDLRKDNPTDVKLSKVLTSVFDELQRWEKVPNRREPFTVAMLTFWEQHVSTTNAHPDSLATALRDWFECGLFAGTRRSEWAQDSCHSATHSPEKNAFDEPKAFCLRDIRIRTHAGARYTGACILQVPCSDIYQCWITFRTQKNGENGEEKTFTHNKTPGGREFVRPMYSIVRRFVALRGPHDNVTPLAIYVSPTLFGDVVKFITAPDVERIMREIASTVYHLDPVIDKIALQRWSCHSLRVGACVILHSLGFTELQIKFLLRWRSNAFMTYLRNLAVLAEKQTQAFDAAGAMPHFL